MLDNMKKLHLKQSRLCAVFSRYFIKMSAENKKYWYICEIKEIMYKYLADSDHNRKHVI